MSSVYDEVRSAIDSAKTEHERDFLNACMEGLLVLNGVSDEEIYDFICKFLCVWEAYVDKTVIMEGDIDYEYENSLTVGGCDADGNEVFNEITKMILRAHYELNSTYPKIKCRFSSGSSTEYLKLIGENLTRGRGTLVHSNDDVVIPALIKDGFSKEHVFDYTVTGCWDISFDDYYKAQCGQFLNADKVLEWSMTMPAEKLERSGMNFISIEDAKNFDEVYEAVVHNIIEVLTKKPNLKQRAGKRGLSFVRSLYCHL